MLMVQEDNVRDRSREAAKEIRRFIEEGIASRKLRAGDKLPNERDLAAQFSTGRNTVRKILVALEEEGKIIRHVGRGTFVKPQASQIALFPGNAEPRLEAEKPGPASIARAASPLDLMELRLSIEPNVAELAVQRASSTDIERMQMAVENSKSANSLQEFEDWDDALHRTIAMSSRNPLFLAVAEIITAVRTDAEWGVLKKQTLTNDLRDMHTQEHLQIVEAIRRRDARGAREAMERHLLNVRKMMFG